VLGGLGLRQVQTGREGAATFDYLDTAVRPDVGKWDETPQLGGRFAGRVGGNVCASAGGADGRG
jgi:hypothetical protein